MAGMAAPVADLARELKKNELEADVPAFIYAAVGGAREKSA